ncbi:MAG TPA: family 10 glycosylhydrolase [Candidatus Sumerlaeota bacterium]|nr:family 10 glycosylhydrolase [Candidatus Sumerlaeota bacterium]HOR27513.1 family 10 glycosylhydrolase [Candidatus Sumerlaeota bacterium]HPK01873.1 family 10 glycosylhydrolase [Candidatus Sumerlaeota bacterium]
MYAQAVTIPAAPSEPSGLPEPQTRGYFFNLVRSISPTSLELELRRVAEAGFNLVVFPVYSNGWTLFQSATAREYGLPSINPRLSKWDAVEQVIRLADRFGLTVWGFARPYNFHPRYSIAEHRLLRKHPDWRLRAHPQHLTARTRRAESLHPCPLNPDYRRFVGSLLAELAAGYNIPGIVINYTAVGIEGGPIKSSPFCFCASCRERFRETHGVELAAEALHGDLELVRAWQRDQMHLHLRYLRHRLLKMRHSLRLVARVRPQWREGAFDSQLLTPGVSLLDWSTLAREGALETLVIDHDNERLGPLFSTRLAADYAYLGDQVLFLPMLSVHDLDDLSIPMAVLRRYPCTGFIGEFQRSFTDGDTQFLARQVFGNPAILPSDRPLQTAAYFLNLVHQTHQDQPELRELTRDILRLISRQSPHPHDFELLRVMEQNLRGLEQAIRRGALGFGSIPERTLIHLGLARRFVRIALMDVPT